MWIEATQLRDGGGPMPAHTIQMAPTWALDEARRQIDAEIHHRSRVEMLIRERMKDMKEQMLREKADEAERL